jgi:hypothetical protein
MKTYTRNIFRDPDIGDTILTHDGVLRVVRVQHIPGTESRVHVRVGDDTTHVRTMFLHTWREYDGACEVIVDGGKREGFTAG